MKKSAFFINKIFFLLFLIIFLVSCSLFDEQLKIIKEIENIANNWDDDNFKEIYVNPNNLNEVNDYKENAFGILRTVCEGKIYFKIVDKTIISDDKVNVTIDMYCNEAVDFKKLGKDYENFTRLEAKKDNNIDYNTRVTLIKKDNKWLIEDFDW